MVLQYTVALQENSYFGIEQNNCAKKEFSHRATCML